MVEEKQKKSKLSITLDVLFILVIVYAGFKFVSTRDQGVYNYCVEWNYNIYRDDLLWKCYDFENKKPICDWRIGSDSNLVVFDYYNSSNQEYYKCSRFAKTIEVEITQTPVFEDMRI